MSTITEVISTTEQRQRELERTRNGAKIMERTLEAAKVEIAGLKSSLAGAQQDNTSLLHLLARIREACGDNGKRMQDELIEYIRDLRRAAALMEKK